MSLEILAVRHAPPVESGVCYGECEVAVTHAPDAAAAVILAALRVAAYSPEHVWSSPAPRCTEPAAHVARHFGLRVDVDDRLLELHFGAWEGRTWREIERSEGPSLERWMRSWETAAPPGGETVAQLTARVRDWYETLSAGRHLVVGHAGPIRALRVIAGGEDWSMAMRRDVPPLGAERFNPSLFSSAQESRSVPP